MLADLSEPKGDAQGPRGARVWVSAIVAGLMAIGLSWGAGEVAFDWFEPEATGRPELGPTRGFIAPEAVHSALLKNAALAFGLQGAILGTLLGVAGGIARGSARASAVAGLAGLVLGSVLGAGVTYAAFTLVAYWVGAGSQEMLPDLLGHVASWSAVGVVAGSAFGWGLGSRAIRAALGGLIGAAVAAAVYEVSGGMIFPFDKTNEPVASAWMARLFAHSLVDLFVALGAAAFASTSGRVTKPSTDESPTAG